MRILLTGANGFIGQHVAKKMQAEKIDFVTVGRDTGILGEKHLKYDFLEISDFSEIVMAANATHLIHLAWYTEHGKYWDSSFNIDWIKATTALVDAFCKKGGKHVAISGTCAEYDWNYGYCSEDITPINPATVYGSAKDATRRICQNICNNFGIPLAWGRIFFPYGTGEPETRLIPSLASFFSQKKPAFGVNGDSYRDLLHVTDVANALVLLSQKNFSGSLNISSGEPVQICEIVRIMADITSSNPNQVLDMPTERPKEARIIVGKNDRLLELGWKKNIELRSGIEDLFKRG